MNRKRLAWRMAPVLVVLLALAAMWNPGLLFSPGDVARDHEKLTCGDCHKPFSRAASESCGTAKCHPTGKIDKKEGVTGIHKKMEGKSCLLCHTDHLGIDGKITRPVDHQVLARDFRCLDCHKGPSDRLHIGLTGDCNTCHGTKAWKPATFDHDRYFPLNTDHKVECAKCHVAKDYKKYTCLNCHAHSSRGIMAEHREEGISNFGDCLRCHQVIIGGKRFGTPKVDEGMTGDGDV